MKKIIIIGLMLISIMILSGCDQIGINQLTDEDIGKIAENVIVCTPPYIRHEAGCCLDSDMNGICDKDEEETESTTIIEEAEETETNTDNQLLLIALTSHDVERCNSIKNIGLRGDCVYIIEHNLQWSSGGGEIYYEIEKEVELSCSDECSSDTCEGKEYIACLKQSDGCKDEVNRGKVIGKCGIECISDNDCGSDEECNNYKCEDTGTSNGLLGQYPYPFIKDCVAELTIVVGDNAPSEDVSGAIDIATSLQYSCGASPRIEVGTARLASEISDYRAQNIISIGNPCDNRVTSDIMGFSNFPDPECNADFEKGTAKIKLYDTGIGKKALVIAGYSAADTRRASKVVAEYDLYQLSGTEVEVSGTSMIDIIVRSIE